MPADSPVSTVKVPAARGHGVEQLKDLGSLMAGACHQTSRISDLDLHVSEMRVFHGFCEMGSIAWEWRGPANRPLIRRGACCDEPAVGLVGTAQNLRPFCGFDGYLRFGGVDQVTCVPSGE